jgi:hypothetical protein
LDADHDPARRYRETDLKPQARTAACTEVDGRARLGTARPLAVPDDLGPCACSISKARARPSSGPMSEGRLQPSSAVPVRVITRRYGHRLEDDDPVEKQRSDRVMTRRSYVERGHLCVGTS